MRMNFALHFYTLDLHQDFDENQNIGWQATQ